MFCCCVAHFIARLAVGNLNNCVLNVCLWTVDDTAAATERTHTDSGEQNCLQDSHVCRFSFSDCSDPSSEAIR